MKKNINEELERLEELVRQARSLIQPMTSTDMIKTFINPDERKKLQEKHPKCWLSVNIGQPAPLLMPICNVTGMIDPNVIDFSLKLSNKLVGRCDPEEIKRVQAKLGRMRSKFDKPTYKPSGMPAKRKGMSTKLFKNIKQYLDSNKLK